MQRLAFIALLTTVALGLLYVLGAENLVIVDSNIASEDLKSEDSDLEIEAIGDITYITDDEHEIYIAKFQPQKELEIVYNPENPQEIQNSIQNSSIAINGGYFLVDNTHAGGLIINGESQALFALSDTQVTHTVIINNNSFSVDIIPNTEVAVDNYMQSDITVFQTGPLILDNNEIQTELITNALNGQELTVRSLFGIDNDGFVYFILTRKVYTLDTLAELLVANQYISENARIVNLDGGSSTALFSKENENFNFGQSKKLPVVITY